MNVDTLRYVVTAPDVFFHQALEGATGIPAFSSCVGGDCWRLAGSGGQHKAAADDPVSIVGCRNRIRNSLEVRQAVETCRDAR
jgi:hypothetical protein